MLTLSVATRAAEHRTAFFPWPDLRDGALAELPIDSYLAHFVPFETGVNPTSVASADLDQDGRPDLVVSNYGGYAPPYLGSVSVLLANGDGTFAPKRDYRTGDASTTVAIGDLNADGKPDVVVANYGARRAPTGFVSVLLGNGDGTLQPKVDYPTGSEPYWVTIGDLNRDEKPDLVVGNWNANSITVLLGVGDGAFTPEVEFLTGGVPKCIAIGDLNDDGIPDLAATAYADTTVSTFLGVGDGTFTSRIDLYTGWYPKAVAIADLNGDGRSELAVATTDSVTIFARLGEGGFVASGRYRTGSIPWFMAIGDLNADGNRDIVTANAGESSVSVLLGNGDGTFGAHSRYLTGLEPLGVAIEDFNGDARPDLAVSCNGRSPGIVAVLLGDGDGTYGPKLQLPVSSRFALLSLSPNPSRGDVRVAFSIPQYSRVGVSVYDLQGRRVAVIAEREFVAGRFEATLSASSVSPEGRSGVYFVRMEWRGGHAIRKLVMTQ